MTITLLGQIPFLEQAVETITLTELRSHVGDTFVQVTLGKTYHITRNGVLIATIHAPEPDALTLGAALRKASRQQALRALP